MPNKVKYKTAGDNKITTTLSSSSVDGSGQGNIGTRDILSANHVRITDVNANTRQFHQIAGLTSAQEYTVSIEYLKITGAPTFRFQIQAYTGGSYIRTIKFTNTEETGLRDVEGWQIARWTFSLNSGEDGVRIWWQDGEDYTQYTHSFELKNPDLRISENDCVFKGSWAINNTPSGTGRGPSSVTGFYNGANIPDGGYAIYSPNGVYAAANDTQLIGKVNSLGANVTGASGALTWAAGQSNHTVLNKSMDNIVTNGLVLNLDASHVSSFNDNQPIVNKVTNAATFNGGWASYSNGNDGTFITEFGTTGYRMSNRGSWNGIYQNFDIGAAGIYTFSAWIKYIGDAAPVTGGAVYVSNYGAGDTASAVNKSLLGVWQRVSITVNVTTPGNVYFYLISWGGTYGGDNHSWEVTMPQIEAGGTLTPFVNGTRSQNTTMYDLSGSNNGTLTNGPTFNSNGYIAFDGVDDYCSLNPSCIPRGNEISISLWNYGINAPNSSIIAASLNNSDQTLNVHLPWSNNGIYWDCGYPFNRIDKIATNAEYQGWHNWVFTKNATTGNMSIYLDGNLWHSGSGHTSPIPVMTVARMGSFFNNNLYHSGRIAKCLIHNKSLTASEILQNYYGSPIVTSGLTYMWDAGNLVSYEPGSVTAYNLAGSKYATLTNGVGYSTGNSGHWTFDGSDDAIFIEGSTNSFSLNQNVTWTVNAWIKTTTSATGLNEGGILSNSNSGPVYSNLQVYNGHIGYTHYNGSWQTSQGLKTVNDGKWHLLTWANIGNGNMNLYVDGVFDSTVDAQLSSSNAIDVIGRSWTGASFNGSIASVQINYITMSQDQVKDNFQAQRNRFGI